jgi:hypothetical protein
MESTKKADLFFMPLPYVTRYFLAGALLSWRPGPVSGLPPALKVRVLRRRILKGAKKAGRVAAWSGTGRIWM